MRKIMSAAALLLASGPAFAADRTIEEFEAAQQSAWNAHDPGAYTAAFDQNAEIVTTLGWHWTGQAEAAGNIGDGFKFVYAHARLRLYDVHVRIVSPELASIILSWSIEGARTIEGGLPAKEQHGLETQLLQRRGASWSIISQQDTATASSPPPSSAPAQATAPAATFPTTPPPVRRCIVARGNGDCLIYGKSKPAPTS